MSQTKEDKPNVQPIRQRDEGELAKVALQLLDRVDLKGGEVPAFVEVRNWLSSKLED